MTRLSGKVAIVTGASKGIGAAIAEAYASEGAAVVVNYSSDVEGAERVLSRINGAGGRGLLVQGDVTKARDVKNVVARAFEEYGRIDTLVNNAGIYRLSALSDITEDEIRSQFEINVFGLIMASQEAAARFGSEGGSILNVSSIASRVTLPGTAVYSGTKGAVDAITEVLAKELGPRGVRVNAISPGVVDTQGTRSAGIIDSDLANQMAASSPLGRSGKVDDVTGLAVFLASHEAKWMTGQVISISGGL